MEQTSVSANGKTLITVNLSKSRWNKMLKLEETYRIARAIRRGMNQVASAKKMTTAEATDFLRKL